MSGMLLGMTLGAWIAFLFGLALIAYIMAQYKIFFTAPREGTVESVMSGNTLSRMILVWKGHRFGGPGYVPPYVQDRMDRDLRHPFDQYEIVLDGIEHPFSYYLNPLNWMEPFGIHWIGIWPFFNIYRYDFVWTEERTEENGKVIPHTRRAVKKERSAQTEGQTPFVRVNDANYFIVASDVKALGNLPLNFTLVITIRIVNPAKALFSGEDWLQRTSAAIGQMVIQYGGKLAYEEITRGDPVLLKAVKGDPDDKKYHLEELIATLSDGKENELYGVDLKIAYGVEIRAVKIHLIELADKAGDTALRDAATQKYVGQQKGEAILAEAQGQAKATRELADAEEYRINKIYSPIAGDEKEARMKIRQLEALEKSGDKGGNTIVIPDEIVGLARRFTK